MTIESKLKHLITASVPNEAAKQEMLAMLDDLVRERDREATMAETQFASMRASYERLLKKD